MSGPHITPPHSTVMTPEDRWLQCIEDWFPQRHSQTYFLPPFFFRKTHHKVAAVPGVPVDVLPLLQPVVRVSGVTPAPSIYPPVQLTKPPLHVAGSVYSLPQGAPAPLPRYQESDLLDDEAAERVLGSLRALSDDQAEAMVVISQLQFRQFLDGCLDPIFCASEAAYCASLPRPRNLAPPSADGDFDVLVVHRQYGLMVMEMKAVGTHTVNASDLERAVKKKVRQAIGQLDKAEGVLRHLLSDRPSTSGVRITKTLVLPNVTSQELLQAVGSDAQLENDLCICLGNCVLTAAVERCLTKDKLQSVSPPSSSVSQHSLQSSGRKPQILLVYSSESDPIQPSSSVSQPSPPSSSVSQGRLVCSGVSKPIQPSSCGSQQSPPSSNVSKGRLVCSSVSQPIQPSSGVSQPSTPLSSVSQPNPPSSSVSQGHLFFSSVSQPIQSSSGVSQPSLPSSGVSQPSLPSRGVSQPSPPSSGVSQQHLLYSSVSKPIQPSSGASQPSPPSSSVSQGCLVRISESQPIQPSSGVSQASPPSSGVGQPSPPSSDESQPIQPSSCGSQSSQPSSDGSQPSPPSSGGSQPSQPSIGGRQQRQPSKGGCQPSPPLRYWWQQMTSQSVGPDPAMCDIVYDLLLARFCGPATSVDIVTVTASHRAVKTGKGKKPKDTKLGGNLGDGIAEAGLILSTLALYPEQVALLSDPALRLLYLCGPPGTGKTVMLVVKAIQELHKGHNVLVLSTGQASRSVAILIEAQLQHASGPNMGTVYLYNVEDFAQPEDMMTLASAGNLFVIADEVDFKRLKKNSTFEKFVVLANSSLTGVSVWCTGPFNLEMNSLPLGMFKSTLTVPLRSPPTVTSMAKRAMQFLKIANYTSLVPIYTSLNARAETDGPPVRRLEHSGGSLGHSEGPIADCEECACDIVLLLKEFGFGNSSGADALHYHDVLITGDYEDVTRLEGMRCALSARGVPSQILDVTDKTSQRNVALALTDKVTLAWQDSITGLERRVVIVLDESYESTLVGADEAEDDLMHYWLALSRSTGQLVIIRATGICNVLRQNARISTH